MTEAATAKKWSVSQSFIAKLKRRARETGSFEPKNGKRRPKRKLEPHQEPLKNIAIKTPGAALAEIQEQLPVDACLQTTCNKLKKLKLTYKKAIESRRARATGRCTKTCGVKSNTNGFDPKKPVFIDETSAKTNMTRLYGRAPRGERLVDHAPHGHWVTNAYVCGLRYNRIMTPHAFAGAMSKERFVDYLKQHLLPILNKGNMPVMDNLSSHKGSEVEMLLASKGASVLYLPAYSPDLNPIELSFSKLKTVLRKLKIRDVGKLRRFLRRSPRLFSDDECKNYFRHAGYRVHESLKRPRVWDKPIISRRQSLPPRFAHAPELACRHSTAC